MSAAPASGILNRTTDASRAVLRTAQPHDARWLLGVLFGVLSALATVALMATSAYLIARAAEQPPILFLSMAVVGVRAFALGRAFFRYLERLMSHDAAFRQLETVRVDLLKRLIPLAPDGMGRTKRGSLLSTLVSDVDELQNLPLRVVQPLLTSLGVALVAVVFVATLSPAAAGVLALLLVLAFVIGSAAVSRVASSAERTIAPKRAALADAVLDYLNSLDVLIAFGAEERYRARVSAADAKLTSALRRRAAGAGVASASIVLFAGLAVAAALLAGIPAVDGGTLTGPALAVITLVPLAVFEIVGMVPLAVSAWRQVRSSAGRIATLAPDTVPDGVATDSGTGERVAVGGAAPIELHDVAVRWPGAEKPALVIPCFRVERGERVLVEGESGSGKTTLAHLLVRFLDHDGLYLLDGQDVRAFPVDSVREVVGLCEQTPYLFNESIRQNLLFARDTASDEELAEVIALTGLDRWAAERGGLDARVGERGALVSGGQAQRIALARALLRGFPVIVLDEPTANVEADLAEVLLTELMAAAKREDRTVVLISHGDVPAGSVDRRVRVSDGVLEEIG